MLRDDPAPRAPEASAARRFRLAALISHPIQYLVPLLRRLAAHPSVDLTVYFMADTGLKPAHVKGYGETIVWDTPLLGGYRHVFLDNVASQRDVWNPFTRLNPGVVRAIGGGRYDALLLHGYISATEWIAYATAKAIGLPILFYGDVLLDAQPGLARTQLLRTLFRRAFVGGLAAALAPSTRARQFYEHYGFPSDRVFWVPLSVDNAAWMARAAELAPAAKQRKRELGLDPDLPAVLYVAHMRPNKRPIDVVRAFERMKVPASLVMVGSGPMYEELARYCHEHRIPLTSSDATSDREPPRGPRVHLAGTQNQGKLPGFYAAADVFVLPSGPGEITPLVVHESMCFSLPLVISDAVPSTIDFVREGDNGFTYPVGDVGALADRLDRVLADSRARAAMGERSRAIISEWSYDVAVRGVVDALAAVVPRKR